MKRNCVFTLSVFLFSACVGFAQAPSIEWAKCLGGTNGDMGQDVVQTTDGGFIVCGLAASFDGDVTGNHNESGEAWIIKMDSAGTIQWKKCYGGSRTEKANSIKLTPDGGYIFAGNAHSFDGDVTGFHGPQSEGDYWIVKIDSVGNIQWQKCYGGTDDDEAYDIELTNDGGYIATGKSDSHDGDVTGNHNNDHWVIKIDSIGNLQWQNALGSLGLESGKGIINAGDSYLELGDAADNTGDVTGVYGGPDAWAVRLDTLGQIIWQKCYGGSGLDIAFGGFSLSNGNFIIAGNTSSNNGDITCLNGFVNAFVLEIDSIGNIVSQNCYGQIFEEGYGISSTPDGGFVIAGRTATNNCNYGGYDDFWIVKIDSAKNLEWSKCLGGYDVENAEAAQQTRDGGFILVGTTLSPDSGDVSGLHSIQYPDYWVVKLSPAPVGIFSPSSPLTDFSIYVDISKSLSVNFYANGNENVKISILNSVGQEVFNKSLAVRNGFNNTEFYPGDLSKGIYLVSLCVNGVYITKKVVI